MFKNLFVPKKLDSVAKKTNSPFSDLNAAVDKTREKGQENIEKFNDTYLQALNYFEVFVNSDGQDKNNLKLALQKFNEAIILKKTFAGPYFYLSYIFHLCKEQEKARKYFKLVKLMQPDFPGLDKLENHLGI